MYKNPFNYIGAKYRLLPQLLPLFPPNITTFVDLFGGSGEVTLNTEAKHYIYNEKCYPLVNIFKNMDKQFKTEVEATIKKWKLTKTSKEEFLALRSYYNSNRQTMSDRESAVVLYCLLTHAFNYQIAYNSKGEYNMPSGAGRSYYSPQLAKKLEDYISALENKDMIFSSIDFTNFDVGQYGNSDEVFLYADPPYLITCGAYERDYFCKWNNNYEIALYLFLDNLNEQGYKWALSNVMIHKGKENKMLQEWSKKYTVHYLDIDYKNCNYHTKDKSANSSVEVLITNY